MDNSTIAVLLTGIGLVVVLAKDLFNGGNKLASAFSLLKEKTTKDITDLRLEFLEKIELRDTNAKVGFEAITANIHALQMGLLEFRAKMAEEYMRRDSYYKASEELKKDFKDKHDDLKAATQEGFKRLEDQIGAVSQAIEAGRKQSRTHA